MHWNLYDKFKRPEDKGTDILSVYSEDYYFILIINIIFILIIKIIILSWKIIFYPFTLKIIMKWISQTIHHRKVIYHHMVSLKTQRLSDSF